MVGITSLVVVFEFLIIVLASQESINYYQSLTVPSLTTFYLLSLPDTYREDGPLLRVFMYFVGAGETGTNPVKLSDVGPFFAIRNNTGNTRLDLGMGDTIFIAPNMPRECNYNTDIWLVREALHHAASMYRIDLSRLTLAGVSTGALGVVQFISAFPGTVAAAAIISGPNRKGSVEADQADGCFPQTVAGPATIDCSVFTRDVHLWLVHGQDDWAGFYIGPTYTLAFYNRLVACKSALFKPRFSYVEQGQHGWDIWHELFINIGNGTWGLLPPGMDGVSDMTIYQWSSQFSLPTPALQTLDTAAPDDQGNVNLVRQSRPPRVTASSVFVSLPLRTVFSPSNVVDNDPSTSWIPNNNANFSVNFSEKGAGQRTHFLLLDFKENVQMGRVVVRSHAGMNSGHHQPLTWKLSLLQNDSLTELELPSNTVVDSAGDMHSSSWTLGEPATARALKIVFPVTEQTSPLVADQSPRIAEIEIWGLILNEPNQSISTMTTTPPPPAAAASAAATTNGLLSTSGNRQDTSTVHQPQTPAPTFTPILEEIPTSSGFVACYCDDFELGLPDGGTNCGETTSVGWAAGWVSKFKSIASPDLRQVDPSVPWNNLQGHQYLRFPSVVDNQWDCMTSRSFLVQAGIPVQVKFRMAVPRLSHAAIASSVNLLRLEVRLEKDSHFQEMSVISFPQETSEAVLEKTIRLGTPVATQNLELQFSVFVSDHRALFYNMDSLKVEFQSNVCPTRNATRPGGVEVQTTNAPEALAGTFTDDAGLHSMIKLMPVDQQTINLVFFTLIAGTLSCFTAFCLLIYLSRERKRVNSPVRARSPRRPHGHRPRRRSSIPKNNKM